jgi:hypothetical protein
LESGAISARAVADGTPSGVLPLKIVSQCREQAGQVYNVSVFEIDRKFRFKSAWFYGAKVELPFSAGAGRKLHCQKRGEITRYSSPHASIWLVRA